MDVEVRQEQQIIIKFLVAAGISGAEINRHLFAVFKSETVSHSRMFKWCTQFCSRRQSVSDGDRACEQHAADSHNKLRLHSD